MKTGMGASQIFLSLAVIAVLAGCARHPESAQSNSAPPPDMPDATHRAASAAAPDGTGAVQAFVDPVTGEMRAPTEAELAALQKSHTQSPASVTSSSSSSVTVTRLPNGVTQYDLGARGNVDETACIQADGSLGECSPAQREALRKSGSAKSP